MRCSKDSPLDFMLVVLTSGPTAHGSPTQNRHLHRRPSLLADPSNSTISHNSLSLSLLRSHSINSNHVTIKRHSVVKELKSDRGAAEATSRGGLHMRRWCPMVGHSGTAAATMFMCASIRTQRRRREVATTAPTATRRERGVESRMDSRGPDRSHVCGGEKKNAALCPF